MRQKEPQNWLTYSGSYLSQRYSQLTQITPANAKDLELKWVFQARWLDYNQATPLVVDGVMYTTQGNDVRRAGCGDRKDLLDLSLHAGVRCQVLLRPHYPRPRDSRRHALSRDRRRAPDRHRREKRPSAVEQDRADATAGYSMTSAPLVIKDKVIVGTAGGEFGIRGFIAAYDVQTGKEAWRFNTVPLPGEPGHETWGEGWKTRRRIDLGDRFLRSRNEPHVLGRWKPGPRLQREDPARRQPLQLFGRRARCRTPGN